MILFLFLSHFQPSQGRVAEGIFSSCSFISLLAKKKKVIKFVWQCLLLYLSLFLASHAVSSVHSLSTLPHLFCAIIWAWIPPRALFIRDLLGSLKKAQWALMGRGPEDVSQVTECVPGMQEALGTIPSMTKTRCGAYSCVSAFWEGETWGSANQGYSPTTWWVQGHPGLYMRPYLKTQKLK